MLDELKTLPKTATNGALVEELEQTFDVSDAAATLVIIANVNGPVTLTAWDKPAVYIHALKRARSQYAFDRTRVELRQEGNQISAITHVDETSSLVGILDLLLHGDSAHVEYTVRAPASCAVQAKTVNGPIAVTGLRHRLEANSVNGPVLMKDVDAIIDAQTVNGALRAESIAGEARLSAVHGSLELRNARLKKLDAHSVNGSLRASLTLAPDGSYAFDTTNGNCELTIPRDSRCTVAMRAVNGGVQCDLPHDVRASETWPTLRRWEAAINGGGAELQFKTVNGRLRIAGADGTESVQIESPHAAEGESRTMEILRAVERGELSVDDALKQL